MLRVSGKVAGGVMGERWCPGIRLGTQANSGEHLVARSTGGTVVRTRAVKQLPKEITIDDLNKKCGKPWAPTGVSTEKVVLPRAEGDLVLKETNEPLTFAPRSMSLTKAILQRFGHTASCAKCRTLCRGEHNTTLTHAKECRERLNQRRMCKSLTRCTLNFQFLT